MFFHLDRVSRGRISRETPASLVSNFQSRIRQTGKTRVDPTLQRSGTRARLRLACKKRARNSKSRGRADPSRRASSPTLTRHSTRSPTGRVGRLGSSPVRMAWHARYGEGDASGVPSRYASTARGGSAIGASAYFMREDDAPRRGSAYARPDPTGHVIAKQARRAFEASRREDESGGESLRYVRSLKYLPRERGEDGAVLEARVSSFASKKAKEPESPNATSSGTPHVRTFGYPTGDNGLGAFEFPATRSVMWDPSAVAETTHISADAHAVAGCCRGGRGRGEGTGQVSGRGRRREMGR